MKKILLVIFLLVPAASSNSQNKIFPQPKIEFNPPHYICYRTDTPIIVDGKLDDKIWEDAEWTLYFLDIEGNLKMRPRFKTRAKMLWDDEYFYIAAQLEEPDLWATLKQRDTIIFYDNDFEVFIDPDGDTHSYYELEINALKTVWDLFLVKPYRDSGGKQAAFNSWDITGLKLGIELKGTINNPGDVDEWWKCEIAIPWKSLRESFSVQNTPKAGEQWRVNFSRVEWKLKNINGKYQKETDPATGKTYPEDNWVWAPTGLINIHYPEMWGFVQLSDIMAGRGKDKFSWNGDENAKWALRKIYYNEKSYFMNNQKYTDDLLKLDLPEMKIEGFIWPPEIEAASNIFEARLMSADNKRIISIKNDGEISIQIK
ncbi:MAG: carbohydrate-binding family 9-like protein [Melioribacteraceae bacterium]